MLTFERMREIFNDSNIKLLGLSNKCRKLLDLAKGMDISES